MARALHRGLKLESQGVTNPYAFGVIGSSDTHTGAAQNDESDFSSKLGILSASVVSAVAGLAVLAWSTRGQRVILR